MCTLHSGGRRSAILIASLLLLLTLTSVDIYHAARANLGWIELNKGLSQSGASAAHLRAARYLFGSVSEASNIKGPAIGQAMAWLAFLDPVTEYSQLPLLDPLFDGARGRVLQVAAMRLVLRQAKVAYAEGLVQQAIAWQRLAADLRMENVQRRKNLAAWLAKKRDDYELAALVEPPDLQHVVRLIVLNRKTGRFTRAMYWADQLQKRFPSDKTLHDLTNPYALSGLAEAYAYFGLFDDAIATEQQALEKHSYGYAHRLMAEYLRQQRRYAEAESHLLAAIAHPENDSLKLQYLHALGDLYVEWGRTVQALDTYCRVLQADPLYAQPRHLVAVLAQISESHVMAFCSQSSP